MPRPSPSFASPYLLHALDDCALDDLRAYEFLDRPYPRVPWKRSREYHYSLQEVSDTLNISRARCGQIQIDALRKARRYCEERGLRGRKKMTSRYGAAISFVFKAQRRAHSRAYATEAATRKTSERASKIGELFFDGP